VTALWSQGARWAGPQAADLRQLLRLGAPAAGQIGLEIAVFGAATMLAGRLSTTPWRRTTSLSTSPVSPSWCPLASPRPAPWPSGQPFGRGEPGEAKRRLGRDRFAGAFMTLAGAAFALAPGWLLGVFTRDPELVAIGAGLLRIAAVFQLFDGLQVAATGVLRGRPRPVCRWWPTSPATGPSVCRWVTTSASAAASTPPDHGPACRRD
jgi:MATE family multidrug resistance protein